MNEKIQTTNKYNEKQKFFEKEESKKHEIMKSQEEGYEQILNKTREHGTIIMTIKNLHKKIEEGGQDFVIIKGDENNHGRGDDGDSIDRKADKAYEQLGVLSEFVDFFQEFNKSYQGVKDAGDRQRDNKLEKIIKHLDKNKQIDQRDEMKSCII